MLAPCVASRVVASVSFVVLFSRHVVVVRAVGRLLLNRRVGDASWSESAGNDVSDGRGESLVLTPSQLGTLLATGQLDHVHSVKSDPTDAELLQEHLNQGLPFQDEIDQILSRMDDWLARVKLAQKTAEAHVEAVAATEQKLRDDFLPVVQRLKAMVEVAATEAAKAETTALLERLSRIHYEQVAVLDRSARFWEERLAKEKELTRIAEAKVRLENSAANATGLQVAAAAASMSEVKAQEKERLDGWLTGLEEQLHAEEAAARQELEGSKFELQDSEYIQQEVYKAMASKTRLGVIARDAAFENNVVGQ
eukprot:TRINITY_DN74018_c0_g1_i1.p1 TRINITY_DN74018_c0_g1~~TRINITY_DN74018_c0_g1_i1.p1  ORF type:complete len:322 (-),score=69.85 TRINITY_DN74018_c0_g1_i1:28-954(-)